MTGAKTAVAAIVGLLLLTGTALGAGWSSHHSMMAGAVRAQRQGQTATYQQFRGQITSVNRGNRWFWMRANQNGRVRIGVGNSTRWSGYGCSWRAMRAGRHISVHAYRHNGSWMAASVQPWMGSWDDHWGDMSDHMDDGWGHMDGGHMGYGWGR